MRLGVRLLSGGAIALGLALVACQPPAAHTAKKWCDFDGPKPAVAPVPVTGAWSFLRCYGDGRLERYTICLAVSERGGVAAKSADSKLEDPLYLQWEAGRLTLRTCAPGDRDCQGVTFTLDATDPYTMYGTFDDGKTTGKARATLEAARDCELDPNEPFIPEVTPTTSVAPSGSPGPSASPSASPATSPIPSPSSSALPAA